MKKGKREAAANNGWNKGGDPFQEEKKGSKPKKEKNLYGWYGLSTIQKVGVVAGGCLAALIMIGVGWWLLFVKAPDVTENVLPAVTDNNPNRQKTDIVPNEQTEDDAPKEKVPGRKDDVFTFLLLGKDTGGGGNTDTMILVSYDVPGGTVDAVSIPRDTMINVSWTIKKINAVFASSLGIDGLKTEVGHLTGIVPDFYVAVEWKAIGEIVTALGGVEFDVPYNMNYDDPYQNLHIHQKKGLRKLSGDDAMQVIRWRKNNDPNTLKITFEVGDTGRQQIQQDFLKAVAKQCLQIGNWTKISQFARIFFENVETDIKLENLLWFAQQAMGVNMDNVTFYSLPGDSGGWYYTPGLGNLSYFFADPAGIVELMNEHFNPYSRDITEADLQVMYKTKNAALGVTNGTLASASMANPSVRPQSTAPKSDPEPGSGTETDEPALPGSGAAGGEGTAADPGTTAPGTTAPGGGGGTGNTASPGGTVEPGSTAEPGNTADPGTASDPGAAAPETPGDPGVPSPPAGGDAPAGPTADPEPELPPEPDPEPGLPVE